MRQKHLLTKTKIVKGFQCEKQLFLLLNKPELAEEESSDEQIKENGILVGELARKRFPKGILIESKHNSDAVDETNKRLNENKFLFEAAFKFEDFLCRVDLLEVISGKKVNLTEVKASTHKRGEKLKEHQVYDAIVQYVILDSLGYKINKLNLLLIDKEYNISKKESDYFIDVDITELAIAKKDEIKKKMYQFLAIVNGNKEPSADLGPHCNNPINCPFKKYCHKQKKVPEVSVLSIQNFPKKYEYVKKGIIEVHQINKKELTENQAEQVRKLKLKRPEIDLEEIKSTIKSWKKPLFFLDFEAFSLAIPIFRNSKPYEKTPYQFSCFSLKNGSLTKEISYIARDLSLDPRKEIAKEIVRVLGEKGTIVVYNQGFEKSIIRELGEVVPKLKPQLELINERIVDLLDLVKKNVYYPEFANKFSIKNVAPVILGEESSYGSLSVNNGLQSVDTYLSAIKTKTLPSVEKALIEYCDKDVIEMINIYLFLENKISAKAKK